MLSKTKEVARTKGAGLGLIAPATAESKQMEQKQKEGRQHTLGAHLVNDLAWQ
jgi:hypothetical protein